MKYLKLIILLAIGIALLGLCLFYLNQDAIHPLTGQADQRKNEKQSPNNVSRRELPGEIFIKQQLINPNGTLRTNLQTPSGTIADWAQGEESLSESLGLWLIYALEKDDRALFEQNVHILTTYFLKDGWMYWKVSHEGQAVTTNALIDDLRIMDALYSAAKEWHAPEYQSIAENIARSILSRQVVDGYFADFYDYEAKWTSKSLTLSYIHTAALTQMYEQQILPEELYRQTLSFLEQLPTQPVFFPFAYQLIEQTFLYHEEVNLIDQLYIVYHRALVGIDSEVIWSFLKEEFYKHGRLYGRYDALQQVPSVQFESPAVYSLAILSAIELQDDEFAQDLYYRMIRQQTLHPESEWYGGYIDYNQQDTHIFDNLLPLIAERKLYNAKLIY